MIVSVVIPAFDEAVAIGAVVRGARSVLGVLEVIVVDDASTDGTEAIAANAGARVLRNPYNLGKGASLRRGVAEATGEVVVVLDGDGQDPPGEIPRLLAAIETGAGLVIGSRFLGRFERGAITALDRLGNRVLSWVFGRLFGVVLTDTQAGFRAVRRDVLSRLIDGLRADGFEIETELLARALRAGVRVVEVPVTRRPRAHGVTRLRRISDGLRILGCMLRLRPPRRTIG